MKVSYFLENGGGGIPMAEINELTAFAMGGCGCGCCCSCGCSSPDTVCLYITFSVALTVAGTFCPGVSGTSSKSSSSSEFAKPVLLSVADVVSFCSIGGSCCGSGC